MENCTRNSISSQRSLSSISASNPNPETPEFNSSSSNTAFVNHALIQWNEQRREWVGNRPTRSRPSQPPEPVISWTSTYEDLLGASHPFSQPVPLLEMVNFLVDVWEQEGLYD